MAIKIWHELEPLVYVLALLLLAGCAPTYTESDEKISGNLVDLQIESSGSSDLVTVAFTFEDKTIHTRRMNIQNEFVFKLGRLNEIYYNSMGIITKVEILE